MSTVMDRTLYLRYIEACNQRDLELADRLTDEMMTADAVFHMPGWPTDVGSGSAGQKAFMHQFLPLNPDYHCAVEDLLFCDDRMVLRGTLQTNHPESGALETSTFLEIDRLVDGKIAESWTLAVPGSW